MLCPVVKTHTGRERCGVQGWGRRRTGVEVGGRTGRKLAQGSRAGAIQQRMRSTVWRSSCEDAQWILEVRQGHAGRSHAEDDPWREGRSRAAAV